MPVFGVWQTSTGVVCDVRPAARPPATVALCVPRPRVRRVRPARPDACDRCGHAAHVSAPCRDWGRAPCVAEWGRCATLRSRPRRCLSAKVAARGCGGVPSPGGVPPPSMCAPRSARLDAPVAAPAVAARGGSPSRRLAGMGR